MRLLIAVLLILVGCPAVFAATKAKTAPITVVTPPEPTCVLPAIVHENRVKQLILATDMSALTVDQQAGIRAMLMTGNIDISQGSDARATLSAAFRNTVTGANLTALFARIDAPQLCP